MPASKSEPPADWRIPHCSKQRTASRQMRCTLHGMKWIHSTRSNPDPQADPNPDQSMSNWQTLIKSGLPHIFRLETPIWGLLCPCLLAIPLNPTFPLSIQINRHPGQGAKLTRWKVKYFFDRIFDWSKSPGCCIKNNADPAVSRVHGRNIRRTDIIPLDCVIRVHFPLPSPLPL